MIKNQCFVHSCESYSIEIFKKEKTIRTTIFIPYARFILFESVLDDNYSERNSQKYNLKVF